MKQVADLSEAELLELFLPILAEHNQRASSLLLGPGDDCAVLDLTAAPTVMSIDTLTEGQDFRLNWPSGQETSGYDLGWKAAVQNLSDIAAMGAEAKSLLVSLSLPADLAADWVQDFARGLTDSCRASGAASSSISGGDLGQSRELSVTVTAVGQASSIPVLRSGAQDGDLLALAGPLGLAAAGLALLDQPRPIPERPELQRALTGQKQPAGAVQAGLQAAKAGAHAMMDVSDGLVRDARRLAQASKVSIDISSAALEPYLAPLVPVAHWLSYQDARGQALHWALSGGEDHAMLATFAPGQVAPGFKVIGRCRASNDPQVRVDGLASGSGGWDHFKG